MDRQRETRNRLTRLSDRPAPPMSAAVEQVKERLALALYGPESMDESFTGPVYPVNPKRESVQGIQAFPDIASLPHGPDLAVICTPSTTVPVSSSNW